MKQQINIKIITNENNRNEKLVPLFNALKAQGRGKLEKNYYLCETNLRINSNKDYQMLFSFINCVPVCLFKLAKFV